MPYYERPDDRRGLRNNRAQPDQYYKGTIDNFVPIADQRDRDSNTSENVETVFGVKGGVERISTIKKVNCRLGIYLVYLGNHRKYCRAPVSSFSMKTLVF